MKKLLIHLKKPADINLTILVKVISDWALPLKKISPFASIIFLCLNVQSILKNKKAIISILILIPLLILHPRMDILRLIFAFTVFWIFLERLSTDKGQLNYWLAAFLSVYSILIFIGIFNPAYYLRMDDGTFRYKFMLESHNAISILAFMIFVYLCETLSSTVSRPGSPWLKALMIIAICSLSITFLFIKSRLYIGLSFSYLSIITFLQFRRSKLFFLMPLFYAGAFLTLTLLTRASLNDHITLHNPVTEKVKGGSITLPLPANPLDTLPLALRPLSKSQVYGKIIENDRLLNPSGTGRNKLTLAVFETFQKLGWKQFIYNNNYAEYMDVKSCLPYIDIYASSTTENSYFTTLITAGFIALIILFYLNITYIIYFIRNKEFYSLLFFLLLLGVWNFEESVMFTFNLIAHLLALSGINRIEKENHESSISN